MVDRLSWAVATLLIAAGSVATSNASQQAGQPESFASIVARPVSVPGTSTLGSVVISWTTGSRESGEVYVSRDEQSEFLFARGSSGSSTADWIDPGSSYEFRLYTSSGSRTLLAATTVRRSSWFRLVPSRWFGVRTSGFLLLVAGIIALLVFRARVGQAASKRPLIVEHASRRPSLPFEFGPVLLIMASLFGKLLYAGQLAIANFNIHTDSVIVSASAATVLLLTAPALLLPRVWRLVAITVIDSVASLVLLADVLYFRRYLDIISLADLPSAPVLLEAFATSVVIGLLEPMDALYAADIALLCLATLFYITSKRRALEPFRLSWKAPLYMAGVGIVVALPALGLLWGSVAAANPAYRGEIAAAVGILPYHFYDAFTRLTAAPAPPPDVARIRDFNDTRKRAEVQSPLWGMAQSKNLILIQAESLQGFPLGLVIDGQPITPNLSNFATESIEFENFFDQTHHGFTSDGEFTALSSLHPLPEGSASVTFRANHYRSMPAILASHGYTTISACAADERVWSMAMTHPAHGFETSLFANRFEAREMFHVLSDGEFFSQMLPRLSTQNRPFAAFLISSSNHGPPFDIPAKHRTLALPDPLNASVLGDYLQSVHYFDKTFGAFVDGLRSSGLLDESVVAIYGDHQAYLNLPRDIAALVGGSDGSTYERWLVDKRLPWLVRLPNRKASGRITAPTGHLDIAPTLLALLGVEDDERLMLGRDATSDAPPFVVFRDGGFANAEAYYMQPRSLSGKPICYRTQSGEQLDCRALERSHQHALDQLAVSDAVLRHDLIPELVSAPVLQYVTDLPPPRAFSQEFRPDRVVVSGFDLWAPATSGATFSVPNSGRPVKVLVAPTVEDDRGADQVGGVIFEIWSASQLLFQRELAAQASFTVALEVPPIPGTERVDVSFVTRATQDAQPLARRANWQSLRFLTDSRALTLRRSAAR